MSCPAPPYFSTLSHKRHEFRGEIELKMCVLLSLELLSETFHILGINELGIFVNV